MASKTAKRYTDKEKQNILNYYKTALKNEPRGAMKRTTSHFGISYTAFKRWIDPHIANKPANHPVGAGKQMLKAFKALLKVKQKEVAAMEKLVGALN